MSWEDWRGRAAGRTVWVVGSGATLDFLDPTLFDGQVVISVNHACLEAGIAHQYVATNHHGMAQELAEQLPDCVVVTSDVEKVPEEHRHPVLPTAPNVLLAPTGEQKYDRWDAAVDWPSDGRILPMGPSSATLALGWAEHLGPARVMLAGLDCGRIDGRKNLAGHRDYGDEHFHGGLWRRSLEGAAAVLRSRGIPVHSVNPWVTLHLEGHTFG